MSERDAYALRNVVGRWLRIRAAHIKDSVGIAGSAPPLTKDEQRAILLQLSYDADHSWLLARLLGGEEPLPFEEWWNENKKEENVSLMKTEFYVDGSGEWRWRVVHENGNILGDSGEGYENKKDAIAAYNSIVNYASPEVEEEK